MSKKSVKENGKGKLDALNPWEQAISDAEKLIQHYRGKIQKLRGAIVGFKDMRDQDVPWPGTTEATEKVSREARSR
jgi:hypothetical protein